MSSTALEGAGSVAAWGFSRALDLAAPDDAVAEAPRNGAAARAIPQGLPPLNILLVAASDPRHIIKTVCRARGKRALNFFLLETQASIYARIMLLLSVLFDQTLELGPQERVELFLELYGNLFVTGKAYDFVKKQARSLISVVTDSKGSLSRNFSFDLLRFRERDDLEFVFKFWKDDDKRAFEMDRLFDYRQRKLYGLRYDSRANVADWDLNMKLQQHTSLIDKRAFSRFRESGIAFSFREQEYTRANRSLATVDTVGPPGNASPKWGYFSDIATGPFCAFGTDCEDKTFVRTVNDRHVKSTQDIAERNVLALLYELVTGTDFPLWNGESTSDTPSPAFPSPPSLPDNVRITFLPIDPAMVLRPSSQRYSKLKHTFDVVYVGNALVHRVPDLCSMLKVLDEPTAPAPHMIVETAKFMVDLSRDQQRLFSRRVSEIAETAKLVTRYRFSPAGTGEAGYDPQELNESLEHLVFVRAEDVAAARIDPVRFTSKDSVYPDWNKFLKALADHNKKAKRKGDVKHGKKDSAVEVTSDLAQPALVDETAEQEHELEQEQEQELEQRQAQIQEQEQEPPQEQEQILIPDIVVTPASPVPSPRQTTPLPELQEEAVVHDATSVSLPDIVVTPATPIVSPRHGTPEPQPQPEAVKSEVTSVSAPENKTTPASPVCSPRDDDLDASVLPTIRITDYDEEEERKRRVAEPVVEAVLEADEPATTQCCIVPTIIITPPSEDDNGKDESVPIPPEAHTKMPSRNFDTLRYADVQYAFPQTQSREALLMNPDA